MQFTQVANTIGSMDEKAQKADALRKVRREADKYRTQRQRLYDAITEADAVKAPKTRIAEAARMSREYIRQVVEKAKKRESEAGAKRELDQIERDLAALDDSD